MQSSRVLALNMAGNPCELNRSLQHHLSSCSDSTYPGEPICRAELNQNLTRESFRLNQRLRTILTLETTASRLLASVASTH
jgi:hypothetical protein